MTVTLGEQDDIRPGESLREYDRRLKRSARKAQKAYRKQIPFMERALTLAFMLRHCYVHYLIWRDGSWCDSFPAFWGWLNKRQAAYMLKHPEAMYRYIERVFSDQIHDGQAGEEEIALWVAEYHSRCIEIVNRPSCLKLL